MGGRSLVWGRHVYRWSDTDFAANAKEGIAIDWPIRYKDIEKWYDHVENFIGITGMKEGLPQLPDGKFLPPMEMNCVEKDFRANLSKNFKGRVYTIGRVAHLTKPHNGRGQCQSRNLCIRGCPYGGYFISNASTLPAAEATTALGRHIILDTIDKCKKVDIEVLYGDTDSLFVKNPTPEQIKEIINVAKNDHGVELEVDKEYRYVVLSNRKKNYLGVTKDGKADVKGLTGKKSHTPKFIKTCLLYTSPSPRDQRGSGMASCG